MACISGALVRSSDNENIGTPEESVYVTPGCLQGELYT